MATVNFQEKLLFYTRRKSAITSRLSDLQMQYLSATRQSLKDTQNYNERLQEAYYDEDYGYGTPEYNEVLEILSSEREFQQGSLQAWEAELDLEKETLETQLNEINNYESTWQKMLQQNIKTDFSYGGSGK